MASCSLPFPELTFLTPQTSSTRRLSLSRVSVSRLSVYKYQRFGLRSRIRAAEKEDGVVVEEREAELIRKVNGVSDSGYGSNGAARKYTNGSVSENGSLVKYVNGNGAAAVVEEVEVLKKEEEEEGRQRKIEEIGKEDAWFKKSEMPKVEV